MKRMISAVLIAAGVILASSALWASGSKENTPPEKTTTINLWNKEGHAKDVWAELVQRYNAGAGAARGIRIEYKYIPAGTYHDVLKVAFSADEQPELCQIGEPLESYIGAGWILPIDSFDGGRKFLESWRPYLNDLQQVFDGLTYRVPNSVYTMKLVYNRDLFKKAGLVDERGEPKPPRTWLEVREYARVITKKGNGQEYGYVMGFKWPNVYNYDIRKFFAAAIGHDGYDPKSGQYRFIDLKPAYELLRAMMADGSFFPSEGLDADAARAQMSEGRVGMRPAVAFDVAVYNDQFPMKADLGFAPIPVFDPGLRYREYAYTTDNVCISSAARKVPAQAFEVFRWINSEEVAVKMYEECKYLPVKQGIVPLAKKMPDKKGWKEFSDSSISYMAPAIPDGLLKIEGDNFNVTSSKILFDTTIDIVKALTELDKRYNEALKKASDQNPVISKYVLPSYDIRLKK